MQKQAAFGFVKSLFGQDQRVAQIQEYHVSITTSVAAFQVRSTRLIVALFFLMEHQISALVDIQDWQRTNDKARATDQQVLYDRLDDLEANQNRLVEILSKCH